MAPPGARYDHAKALRVSRFFALHLRHTKGKWKGQPFVLEDWQFWHVIAPTFGVVEVSTGLRWYRDAVVCLPRKHGKSAIASGIAAYMLTADGEGSPEVYSLAKDRKQAGIVFREAKKMMQASPLLRRLVGKGFYKDVIEVSENDGMYQVLSRDADAAHGSSPSCALIDEYWAHPDDELREAMQTGTAAREQPLMVTIGTVPRARTGPMWVLIQPYVEPKEDDRPLDPRTYFYLVGAPRGADAGDRRTWRRAVKASWITMEYLAAQYAKLPLRSFEQFHLNRIPEGKGGDWLPPGGWEKGAGTVVIDSELPSYIGVDAAPKRDSTAVVMVQRRPADGTVHARVWVFRADPNLGYLDFELVEALLRELAAGFLVRRIATDPYAMMRSMMLLANEGLPVEDFPQTHQRMVPASMGLRDIVLDGSLRHGGDKELADASSNATTQTTSFGWRLVQVGDRKIDALIALAIAVRVMELDEQAPSETVTPTVIVV